MKRLVKPAVSLVLTVVLLSSMCIGVFAASSTPSNTENAATLAADDAQLSRTAAAQGMVLLENSNKTLPIRHGSTVAMFGSGQINFFIGGTGSGAVTSAYTVNLLQGMQNKQTAGEISLYKPLADAYTSYISGGGKGEMTVTTDQVTAAAQNASTAVIDISRQSGEGSDRTATAGDYYLSSAEITMLNQVYAAFGQNVVVVLNIGGVMDTSWIKNYPGISVLLAYQPGMEGGDATADVLCGDVDPSGKTVDTFAANYNDYPSSSNFSQHTAYVDYSEDIYDGYRYFETFDPSYDEVVYPFGYGLSYTTFKMSNVTVTPAGKNMDISATVTNTGTYAGQEVAEVYFGAPDQPLDNPGKVLSAFAKTGLLQPGQSQTLNMSYAINDMASYDDTGIVQKSAYVLEAGNYNIYVGDSIKDAGQQGSRYTYTVGKTIITQQLTQEMAPTKLPERLTNDNGTPVYESLQTAGSGIYTISASGTSTVQSEDFSSESTITGNDPTIETYFDSSGNTGKCLAFMAYVGNTVTYNLNVAQAGTYNLTFNASNGRAQVTNMLKLYVNGTLQPNVNVTVPQTGDGSKGQWYNFQDVAPVTITLPAGQVTLQVVSNSGNCGNLNSMTFQQVTSPQTQSQPQDQSQTPTQSQDQSGNSMTTVQTGTATTQTQSVFDANVVSTASNSDTITLMDVYNNPDLMDQFIAQLSNEQLADLAQGTSTKIAGGTGGIGNLTDYGIPIAQTSDGPAGLRLQVPTTAWPVETLEACSWDVNLVKQIGVAVGKEAKENDVDIWLAPAMDIHRDPLDGRNFEYYSEDPLISGDMAAAEIEGVQSQGIGATVKHFACNERETNRDSSDSRVSERALREVYLKGFQIAIEQAHPWAVMTSYNLINGTETSENADLLTNILRNEWGYTGAVMTDWGNNSVDALEVKAGNNIKMPSGDPTGILNAVTDGYLTRDDLVTNAKYILNLLMKTNVFLKQQDISTTDPTHIKANDYNFSSANVQSQACSDTDGGMNPSYTTNGEWLSYQVDVQKGGTYGFTPRVAGMNNNSGFDIYVDSTKVGSYNMPTKTADWQSWITGNPVEIQLPQGAHTLKVAFTDSSINLNYFDLTPVLLTADISNVTNPDPISVAYGTALNSITTLPQSVYVNLSDGEQTSLPVTWSDPSSKYDSKTAGDYDLTGTLTLPADGTVTNSQNITADLKIAVQSETTIQIDQGNLANVIATANGLVQSKYTSDTWSTMQTALQAAEGVTANPAATQDQLETAINNLTAAINGLKTQTTGGQSGGQSNGNVGPTPTGTQSNPNTGTETRNPLYAMILAIATGGVMLIVRKKKTHFQEP